MSLVVLFDTTQRLLSVIPPAHVCVPTSLHTNYTTSRDTFTPSSPSFIPPHHPLTPTSSLTPTSPTPHSHLTTPHFYLTPHHTSLHLITPHSHLTTLTPPHHPSLHLTTPHSISPPLPPPHHPSLPPQTPHPSLPPHCSHTTVTTPSLHLTTPHSTSPPPTPPHHPSLHPHPSLPPHCSHTTSPPLTPSSPPLTPPHPNVRLGGDLLSAVQVHHLRRAVGQGGEPLYLILALLVAHLLRLHLTHVAAAVVTQHKDSLLGANDVLDLDRGRGGEERGEEERLDSKGGS